MKRLTTMLVATSLTMSIFGQAARAAEPAAIRRQAQEPQKTHGIYFDPVAIAFGQIGLGYEHVLSRHLSLQIGASYVGPWSNDDEIWGLGGELRAFVYPLGRAPGGLYVAPLVRVAYARGDSGGITASGLGWGAGGTIGWTWLLGPVGIRAGIGALYYDIEATGGDGAQRITLGYSGPSPTADLAIGFVF